VLVFVARSLRFLALTAVLVPLFLVRRLGGPTAGPRVLRWYFQTSGATFVKLGQLLATRYDLLPAAYCEELATLLDSLPPEPLRRIVATIERDLGRPLATCFEDFELAPLASASVAQVHGARLLGGERVVVKVLRPGIEQRFRVDFFYFRLIAWFIHRLGVLPNVDLREIVRELRKLSSEETDLRREARNLREMHDLTASDDIDHYAPEVYPEYSARAPCSPWRGSTASPSRSSARRWRRATTHGSPLGRRPASLRSALPASSCARSLSRPTGTESFRSTPMPATSS
jgi:predicted unusual protein kinase regulating ubiquinone biosynthesis (AarF/ABC1/UbiB family)